MNDRTQIAAMMLSHIITKYGQRTYDEAVVVTVALVDKLFAELERTKPQYDPAAVLAAQKCEHKGVTGDYIYRCGDCGEVLRGMQEI